jgi:putative membrane protein
MKIRNLCLMLLASISLIGCAHGYQEMAYYNPIAFRWADLNFAQTAAISNQFEIMSSRLALHRSHDPRIREFAQAMISDHSKMAEAFNMAVKNSGFDPSNIPTKLDDMHEDMLNSLKRLTGSAFNRQYIADQRQAHSGAVLMFRNYAHNGRNRAFENFAEDSMPMLEHHEQWAYQINLEPKNS